MVKNINMETPLVSIILCTYNGSKYIKESIESVLSQTYTNFELIIINDCSTDNVEQIILEYQKKDNRIIYIKNEKNLKLTKSLNKWIELSNWKYIARIDDDDIWCDKDKLLKQVNFMELNNDYWLYWTGVILIDENWNEYEKMLNRPWDQNIRWKILWSNQFAHSSIIIRKELLQKTWVYEDSPLTLYTEDYDLWLRIWIVSKFDNLQECSVKYRVRKWSISWKKRFKQLSNAFKVHLKYRKFYPNKTSWILKHIVTIIMPKYIVELLVKLYKKIV